jgi:hypothetical protein
MQWEKKETRSCLEWRSEMQREVLPRPFSVTVLSASVLTVIKSPMSPGIVRFWPFVRVVSIVIIIRVTLLLVVQSSRRFLLLLLPCLQIQRLLLLFDASSQHGHGRERQNDEQKEKDLHGSTLIFVAE